MIKEGILDYLEGGKNNGKMKMWGDFLGGPVVKIPCSQCRGHGFNP